MKPPKLTENQYCRIQGGKLIVQGYRNCEILKILPCGLSRVKRWRKIVQQQGVAALAPKPRPGRKPKLDEKQLAKLKRLLKKGATKFGDSPKNRSCGRKTIRPKRWKNGE